MGEATGNVVRHAYQGLPDGDITIRIELVDGNLSVKVSDRGSWRAPRPEADSPGLGTTISQAVTDDLGIIRGEDGTDVLFRVRAGPDGD